MHGPWWAATAAVALCLFAAVAAHPHNVGERLDPASSMRIIGHRGGMVHWVPEHTILSYTLGAELGAAFIEPDVVPTKDNVLVCRHDVLLDDTTDVGMHPEFAHLRSTKTLLFPWPHNVTGFFVQDFTWAELQTLYAVSRDGHGAGPLDRTYRILRFSTVLELAHNLTRMFGRTIGVYPEPKHGDFFDQHGFNVEAALMDTLKVYGYVSPDGSALSPSPVVVQAFPSESLKRIAAMSNVPRVQLIVDPGSIRAAAARGSPIANVSAAGLADIATYATGVGMPKSVALQPEEWPTPGHLLQAAHLLHLRVDVYTLDANLTQYEIVDAAGVDGVFSNNVEAAFIVEELLPELQRRTETCDADKKRAEDCRWALDEAAAGTGAALFVAFIAVIVAVVMCCAQLEKSHRRNVCTDLCLRGTLPSSPRMMPLHDQDDEVHMSSLHPTSPPGSAAAQPRFSIQGDDESDGELDEFKAAPLPPALDRDTSGDITDLPPQPVPPQQQAQEQEQPRPPVQV